MLRERMKKTMQGKKDNKGFSLVELIVVVLIMAIIAVALAPQVMEWVNKSRMSTDAQTLDSIKSTAQLALTDKNAYAEVVAGTPVEITCSSTGLAFTSTGAGGHANFQAEFLRVAGLTALDQLETKVDSNTLTVTLTYAAADKSVSVTASSSVSLEGVDD